MVAVKCTSPRVAVRRPMTPTALAMGATSLQFDATAAAAQDASWRAQRLLKPRSPRLLPLPSMAAFSPSQVLIAELERRTEDQIVASLLDNDLNVGTFLEYLQQSALSPAKLMPWLQTLASLASKVGMLLESTRFLTCDLQLARILMHMQVSARSLCGAKRAVAYMVHVESASLWRVGDRGEVAAGEPESLQTGTSFAAHCARSAKPLLVGLPGSAERTALGARGLRACGVAYSPFPRRSARVGTDWRAQRSHARAAGTSSSRKCCLCRR